MGGGMRRRPRPSRGFALRLVLGVRQSQFTMRRHGPHRAASRVAGGREGHPFWDPAIELCPPVCAVQMITNDRLQARALLLGIGRSEEHTSELQSLMRISYAVFCLHKKQQTQTTHTR